MSEFHHSYHDVSFAGNRHRSSASLSNNFVMLTTIEDQRPSRLRLSHYWILGIVALAPAILASCVSIGVIPLSSNTARVVVDRASDGASAQREAFRHAAIVTIQCGFDRFTVLTADTGSSVSGSYMFMGATHKEVLTFRMLGSTDDPEGTDSIDAREVLGKNWKGIVERERRDDLPRC